MCNTKTILREFNAQNSLYREFGDAVENLLESILKKEGHKYQLSYRVKSLDSIKEKIKRKKTSGKIYKHLNEIDDVVGLRVIFYTKKDCQSFVRDLRKEFEKNLQIEETSKTSGYKSTHAVASFSKQRIRLAEYQRFKGLKCEIQMTLILNHAWAEVEHDILYKERKEIQKLDKKEYVQLKKKMEHIMHDYIQKASSGLESVIKNIKKPHKNNKLRMTAS